MLVRRSIEVRIAPAAASGDRAGARLPRFLKPDQTPPGPSLLRRLGPGAGVRRRGAGVRDAGPGTAQRVVVKARVCRHAAPFGAADRALAGHLAYLGRGGAGRDGARPDFFDEARDGLDAAASVRSWSADRHHFRLIISPEHGDRITDLAGYTREVMRRVAIDLREPQLSWLAVCHFDTARPHAHVVVRGRRADGRDLVIPRAYVSHGLRGRAQEVAAERLGSLSRHQAERRVWRETRADRFTGFDRRLLQAIAPDGLVGDGVGQTGPWAALTRARLTHLEALGLAERLGGRFRLHPDLEGELRRLQARREVARLVHAHQLATGRKVQALELGRVKGRVVGVGRLEGLGAMFVIVRGEGRCDRWARLAIGQAPPRHGRMVRLDVGAGGARLLSSGRSRGDLAR